MADTQILPIPLATPQMRSAHPWFAGVGAQTKRSKNLWVDERGRLRRRPGKFVLGDHPSKEAITGFFEYEYRYPSSKSSRTLLAVNDGRNPVADSALAGVDIVSDKVPGEFTSETNVLQSRVHLTGTITRHSGATVKFIYGERVDVFLGGVGAGDGAALAETANYVVVDNLNYASPAGGLILRSITGNLITHASSVRVLGSVSGANVRFTRMYHPKVRRRVWTAALAPSGTEQQWIEGSVVNFAQYGHLCFMADDSNYYPLRVWSGSNAEAQVLNQAPRASIVTTHQTRVWLGALERNGAEIVGSAVGDPYSWEPDGQTFGPISLFVEQDDRDEITGMAPSFRGDFYIWKRKSLHRIVGEIRNFNALVEAAPFTRQTVTRSIGCCSNRSILHVGNDIFWMSDKGVHSMEATDKYGDIDTAYLSFPVADVFENLNIAALKVCQAVFLPRLGLYCLGVPLKGSREMNLLLVYATSSKRWMTWDIGSFTALGLGPTRGDETESLYVGLTETYLHPELGTDMETRGKIAILDFTLEVDYDEQMGVNAVTPIDVVIEPGVAFTEPPELRYPKKSAERIQVYFTSPGEMTSKLIYSWDGGEEIEKELNLNPQGNKAFGTGWAIGKNQQGNKLTSEDSATVASTQIVGRGHVFLARIEDSNPGRLPYLHADLEFSISEKDYTATSKR